MFIESNINGFTLTFDSWTTDRRIGITALDYQLDIGSSSDFNCPKYFIAAQKTEVQSGVPTKANNMAIFCHHGVRKYFVEINGKRYMRDAFDPVDTRNDYINQYRDLKAFFREYVGEPILSPLTNYTDMKNNYLIQVKDLWFSADHIPPKKFQIIEEYRAAPKNARIIVMLIKHRQIKMIPGGYKFTQNTIMWNDNT